MADNFKISTAKRKAAQRHKGWTSVWVREGTKNRLKAHSDAIGGKMQHVADRLLSTALAGK